MQVLVYGSGGMLGTEVCKQLNVERGKADITNFEEVLSEIKFQKPQAVVNCAAYTAVDLAEDNPNECFAVNALGVRNLAIAGELTGVHLVHISTDYVFGGSTKRVPFEVDDQPSPLGVYGWSKFTGEESLKAYLSEKAAIIRTSWLHGPAGKNFLQTIFNAAQTKSELRVVDDQFGCPTYTVWLAGLISKVLESKLTGVFHGCSSDVITWFDFAKEIVDQAGLECEVIPQSTAESGRTAKRPSYSALSTSSLKGIYKVQEWTESVSLHLRSISQ